MARNIDFNALKARTMGSGNDEEAVTVDTRGLISKVLSRYSGKWTVLREMIQNAADASATRVTIKFETLPSTTVPLPNPTDPTTLIKHVISHHTLKRLLISNNGIPFSEKDWARLKRIADGNPDETKIGAFGVGFYSVFDDCEEPFVSSGGEAMAFYWKGNALFTRRLQLGEAEANPDTTFVLDYRNDSSPVPSLMQLCQFLASSLTFVGLESIDLWLDDWNLLKLTKKTAPSVDVILPRDVETRTADGLMKVMSVSREVAQVDAVWMGAVEWKSQSTVASRLEGIRDTTGSLRTFFSRFTSPSSQSLSEKPLKVEKADKVGETEDLTKTSTASVFLHINTASIQASISQSLSNELERATRKPPPKKTTLAILTPSYDANMAAGAKSEILASVLPSKSGRVFIGFPTHQTTGLNAHISAPSVIPTVERESIDLNTRYISKWNHEMLRAAGIVCRIAWSAEMASIKARISPIGEVSRSSKVRKEDIVGVLPEAVHTANQFVFRESTPSSQLGQTIEDSFWMCNKNASIEILSSRGIIPTHEVRIAPKELSFMDSIPVLPEDLILKAKDFVKKLTDFGLVTEITVSDIKRELEASSLTSKQLSEFLLWVGRKAASGELDHATVRTLLRVAVANDETADGVPSRLLVLAEIDSYLNPQRIPADLPLPLSVMPFKYTKTLGKRELEALGWVELQTVPWIRWLVEDAGNRSILQLDQDMTRTSSFSAQVLPVLSKQWDGLSQSSKQTIVNLLQPQTVIPTKGGLKRPPETYFPSVRLFDDLPTVHGLNGVKEKFLAALGVRKTVELGVIFERLLNNAESVDTSGPAKKKWSHVDLIKYLASVRDDIPAADIERLKNTKICTAEIAEDSKSVQQLRYKVSELFEPKDSLRSLGLPVIEWPGRYQSGSSEGKFLTMLGLRAYPSAPEVIQLMAKATTQDNLALQGKALSYFISEHYSNGYAAFDSSKAVIPYLPVDGSKRLSTPSDCFTNDGAALFGLNILRRDLHPHASKLGVRQHPSMTDCINILIKKPPATKREARTIFGYMTGRVGEIGRADADRIGRAPIVPVSPGEVSEKPQRVRHVAPKLCYLGDSEDYGDIFDFVDFGQEANVFLMAMGSKPEPTKVEIARILVKEPARISSKFQSPEKYLRLLTSLAEHLSVLKKDRELFSEMKKAPFLLASKELPSQSQKKVDREKLMESDDEDIYGDEDLSIKEWQLTVAKDAVIVDDYQSFSLFKEHVLAAPQEEILENFYISLGAPPLSSIVEEQAQWGSVSSDQRPAVKLQKLLNERSRLFLHDQSPDSIRHDTRWLEKHLNVQVVHSISLRRSLKGRRASHTQKRSAIITQQSKGYALWICPGKYDLYQISQALVHLILMRPKLHSTLTLEMLLKTDLLELRARGYNVERILKQKAQEARIAEDRRQKQLEEERKRLQEREAEWAKAQEQQAEERKTQDAMPGLFPDSPQNSKTTYENQPEELDNSHDFRPRSLFSNLTKRLGLDEAGRTNNRIQSFLQGQSPNDTTEQRGKDTPPPPYTAEDPRQPKPEEPKAVTSPHMLQTNLLSAIQSCRPHGASSVYSPPEINQVTESKSYCDERPSHDLEFAATLASGINFLIVKSIGDRTAFLAENTAGINAFASILADCAGVFAVRVDSISIFYDPGGKTIAFNRGGSLFCNYHYFKQLHQMQLLQNPGSIRGEALVYWWVVLCHELAHNLVADHSSDHSYYTESFVTQYFPKVALKLSGSVAA